MFSISLAFKKTEWIGHFLVRRKVKGSDNRILFFPRSRSLNKFVFGKLTITKRLVIVFWRLSPPTCLFFRIERHRTVFGLRNQHRQQFRRRGKAAVTGRSTDSQPFTGQTIGRRRRRRTLCGYYYQTRFDSSQFLDNQRFGRAGYRFESKDETLDVRFAHRLPRQSIQFQMGARLGHRSVLVAVWQQSVAGFVRNQRPSASSTAVRRRSVASARFGVELRPLQRHDRLDSAQNHTPSKCRRRTRECGWIAHRRHRLRRRFFVWRRKAEDSIRMVINHRLPIPAAFTGNGQQFDGFRIGRERRFLNRTAGAAQSVANAHRADRLFEIPARLAIARAQRTTTTTTTGPAAVQQHEMDRQRRLCHLFGQILRGRRFVRIAVRTPIPPPMHHGVAAEGQSPLPDMQMAGLPKQIFNFHLIPFCVCVWPSWSRCVCSFYFLSLLLLVHSSFDFRLVALPLHIGRIFAFF